MGRNLTTFKSLLGKSFDKIINSNYMNVEKLILVDNRIFSVVGFYY
jgi:hypothetical protein